MALNKIKINDTTTVNTGVVYDITKATGQSYTDFKAALGTDGNNVPLEIREGGMTVRFVSNSDNKYVQYRLMATSFSTSERDWQRIDEIQVELRIYAVGTVTGFMNNQGELKQHIKGGLAYRYNVRGYDKVLVSILSGTLSLGVGWCTIWVVNEEQLPILMIEVDTTGNIFTDWVVQIPSDGVEIWVQGYVSTNSTVVKLATVINMALNYIIDNINYTDVQISNEIERAKTAEQANEDAINKLLPMGETVIIKDSDTNLLLNTTFTNYKYLDKNNGKEVDFGTFSYTDYIDITGISHLKIYNVPLNGGCFYDEEKNYISGFGYANGSLYHAVIEVPENAVYVRVNVDISTRNVKTAYVMDNSKCPKLVDYPWIDEREVETKLHAIGTASGYMAGDGTINTSLPSGGTITKYDVIGVESVSINMTTGLSLDVTQKWCTIWVVDESDNPILMLPVDNTGNVLEKYHLTIPENGVQIWLQSERPEVHRLTKLSTVILDIQNTIDELQREISSPVNQWTGKKIVWLGTSIPYGQGTDGVASALTTYPMQVGSKLGATVVNVARPGMAIETTEDFKRKTYGSLSLTIAELQSEGATTTPYQSYENAMLGQDADLYIFDCEPNNSNWNLTDLENFSVQNWAYNDSSTFESHRNSYVGALLFLLDKLWTENPSAKVVFISEFISGSNLDSRYQGLEASKAVAEKLRIPLIDVASKLYYTPLNKSLYLNSDNVHPKQATHDRIANILSKELLTVS